ncbi:uncharacterized protein LOC119726815 [Patiria miniata]|uniref:Uncharacterized protein n=1 Tax=Patiria miniata TaxID=46514 RepID=A0A913ZS58_PATMI|nr:uncharacterized protein LOC119726815 [Patiria miniata]
MLAILLTVCTLLMGAALAAEHCTDPVSYIDVKLSFTVGINDQCSQCSLQPCTLLQLMAAHRQQAWSLQWLKYSEPGKLAWLGNCTDPTIADDIFDCFYNGPATGINGIAYKADPNPVHSIQPYACCDLVENFYVSHATFPSADKGALACEVGGAVACSYEYLQRVVSKMPAATFFTPYAWYNKFNEATRRELGGTGLAPSVQGAVGGGHEQFCCGKLSLQMSDYVDYTTSGTEKLDNCTANMGEGVHVCNLNELDRAYELGFRYDHEWALFAQHTRAFKAGKANCGGAEVPQCYHDRIAVDKNTAITSQRQMRIACCGPI